jgi:peroxiredoxin
VIAQDGTIVHVYSNLDPKQHVSETLAALKSIKAH